MPGALVSLADGQLPNRPLIDLMMAPGWPMPPRDEQ